jgi:hypothetical protein
MKKYIDTGKKDTRSGFGVGLLEAGKADSRVVALTADLKGSLKMDAFAAEFPERFIQCGIAEANMIGVAAGLAITGKIPFAGSFAEFVTGRVYDQIRQEVSYGETNVKIASSHAGITLGEDGATHQTMEDVALMRALPGMVVINPCDFNQTVAATIGAVDKKVRLDVGKRLALAIATHVIGVVLPVINKVVHILVHTLYLEVTGRVINQQDAIKRDILSLHQTAGRVSHQTLAHDAVHQGDVLGGRAFVVPVHGEVLVLSPREGAVVKDHVLTIGNATRILVLGAHSTHAETHVAHNDVVRT